ncbi:hypothetical protein P154DRAFT_517615 [Amniculicola lignicola CBS 123094]|uniref:Uncharacterized protein n=1 Tax=Amniculicola lignicola CBS 123094 TaxID=1392246 RepID=A0A6A5WZF7_9PLEO|nr:hypothetical protein P154DRAFT_517615 [Amniculicola lignicola CBS 123094]
MADPSCSKAEAISALQNQSNRSLSSSRIDPVVPTSSKAHPATPLRDSSDEPNLGSDYSARSESGFGNQMITVRSGSRWRVKNALSKVKRQDSVAPCEATQVYTAICLDEAMSGYKEAVIKIKYQIRANKLAISGYEFEIKGYKESLRLYPDRALTGVGDMLNQTQEELELCSKATSNFNNDTLTEMQALDRLSARNCPHAPWLLDTAIGTMHSPGIDAYAIPGGYVVYTLMTKLSGNPIKYHEYWRLDITGRNKIREAFKVALI